MQRVALLAPRDALRDLLVNIADEGTVALDDVTGERRCGHHRDAAPLALQRLQAARRAGGCARADGA